MANRFSPTVLPDGGPRGPSVAENLMSALGTAAETFGAFRRSRDRQGVMEELLGDQEAPSLGRAATASQGGQSTAVGAFDPVTGQFRRPTFGGPSGVEEVSGLGPPARRVDTSGPPSGVFGADSLGPLARKHLIRHGDPGQIIESRLERGQEQADEQRRLAQAIEIMTRAGFAPEEAMLFATDDSFGDDIFRARREDAERERERGGQRAAFEQGGFEGDFIEGFDFIDEIRDREAAGRTTERQQEMERIRQSNAIARQVHAEGLRRSRPETRQSRTGSLRGLDLDAEDDARGQALELVDGGATHGEIVEQLMTPDPVGRGLSRLEATEIANDALDAIPTIGESGMVEGIFNEALDEIQGLDETEAFELLQGAGFTTQQVKELMNAAGMSSDTIGLP